MAAERALVAREQPRGIVRVSFVDVGQGDSSLVDLPDGRLLMIDTGQGGRHPAVREVRKLLASRRRSRIDVLVITHGHPDHYGGLADLLDEVDIGEIWLNGQLLSEQTDGAMEHLLNYALARGARLRFAPELCASAHAFGEARIQVLWPCPRYDPTLDLNDNSLVLRLTLGRRSFLFTGDLEAEAEARLVESGRIASVDVLKVAHHGSRTSTTATLVDAARPALAVISSGSGNRYGHPSPLVLSRLRSAGATIHRTDIQGGLIVSTDGERLDFER
jgi:competence protein ComEC